MISLKVVVNEMDSNDPLNKLKRDPELASLFAEDAGLWPGLTIEGHTLAVLSQFEKYFGGRCLPGQMKPDVFRLMLAAHDVGKPIAIREGDKRRQHIHTKKLLKERKGRWGVLPEEMDQILALVDGDPIGSYLKGHWSLKKAAAAIRKVACHACMPRDVYFDLLTIYYQADASAYTSDAGQRPALDHLFKRSENGQGFEFDGNLGRIVFSPDVELKFRKLENAVKKNRCYLRIWIPAVIVGVGLIVAGLVFFGNQLTEWGEKWPFVAQPDVLYKRYEEYVFVDMASLDQWTEKIFKGQTQYKVLQDVHGKTALKVTSQAGASALYREINISMERNPVLTWQWRVERVPDTSEIDTSGDIPEKGTDFPARVFAIFRGATIWTSEVIQYAWDPMRPEGWSGVSPVSNNIRILVVQSGLPSKNNGWETERRNLVEDYKSLFGKKPKKKLGAIALMSDSDHSNSVSSAFYTWLAIELPEEGETP